MYSTITIDIKDVSLNEAVQHITAVSGHEIILLGTYEPTGRHSLHVNETSLDEAIKRLFIDYDYFILHGVKQQIIFVVGPANDDTVVDSDEKQIETEMDSIADYEVLPPEQDQDSNHIHGQFAYMEPDGILEWIPDEDIIGNTDPGQYDYAYMPDGLLEVIPVETSDESTKIKMNQYVLSHTGPDGMVELIVENAISTPQTWETNIGPEGLLEVIPAEE